VTAPPSAERPAESVLRSRIHVGSGPKALKPEWWNVDLRGFPGVDAILDVSTPWKGYDNVKYVYGEHFIEHLTPIQAAYFLTYAYDSMAVGGRIRLSTPSLEWVFATHYNNQETDQQKMIANTFTINRAFHGWGHRFLWSRAMLDEALMAIGYKNIKFYAYGQSDDPFLRNIEEHGGYVISAGFPNVWIVEGEKTIDQTNRRLEFVNEATKNFQRYVDAGH
jgi:predicted SAM-dependent methyltransferase